MQNLRCKTPLSLWLSGNVVGDISEVIRCQAALVLKWVTVLAYRFCPCI